MLTFSEGYGLVAKALLAIQREIKPIVKDRKNNHLGNSYATLDAITDYLRPLVAKHECAIVQSMGRAEGGITVCSRILHVSGEWVESTAYIPLADQKGVTAPQVAGSAMTYGRRYSLAALFAITTDEDDDGASRGTRQRREARAESAESAAINAAGATNIHEIPFWGMKGLEAYKGKPLREVPTDVLTTAYNRAKGEAGKLAKAITETCETVLEARRDA